MTVRRLAVTIAAGIVLTAKLAPAQVPQSPVTPVAFDYSYYAEDSAPSPSDAPVAKPADPAPVAASVGCDANGGCDSCGACDGGGCDGCGSCNGGCSCGGGLGSRLGECCLDEPWTLFNNDNECRRTKITGWTQFGFYSNEFSNASNGPLGFNNEANGVQLHQLWVGAERAVDTGGCGADWGYRLDYVFGVDGPDTQAFGNLNGRGYDNEWDASSDYGSALPQLYGTIGYNDWVVKLGHFYTLMGYEVVQATGNFFYSHSYAQYYAEPFTHTGAMATYNGREDVAIHAGYVFGWDTGFDDGGSDGMFHGGFTKTLNENVSIGYMLCAGDFGQGRGDLYHHTIMATAKLTEDLTYVIQHDTAMQTDGAPEAEWYGINQYLFYALNDCWKAGLRFEWMRDDDGTRILPGTVGNFYEVSTGLNWRATSNVTVRPEVRYDFVDVEAGALPFNSGTDDEQFSGGLDIIFTF